MRRLIIDTSAARHCRGQCTAPKEYLSSTFTSHSLPEYPFHGHPRNPLAIHFNTPRYRPTATPHPNLRSITDPFRIRGPAESYTKLPTTPARRHQNLSAPNITRFPRPTISTSISLFLSALFNLRPPPSLTNRPAPPLTNRPPPHPSHAAIQQRPPRPQRPK